MKARQSVHAARQDHLFGTCAFLQRDYYERGGWRSLYDSPWDDEPLEVYFHSGRCEEAYMHSDSFGYQWCEGCERDVCVQNPASGWHTQFRPYEDESYCLRCYEGLILEHGQPREDFEGDKIRGGMFFSAGNVEPKEKDFEEVEGFYKFFVQDRAAAKRYNARALELIGAGQKVITGYERMAIGGLEAYEKEHACGPVRWKICPYLI